jgi:hypothetical protein
MTNADSCTSLRPFSFVRKTQARILAMGTESDPHSRGEGRALRKCPVDIFSEGASRRKGIFIKGLGKRETRLDFLFLLGQAKRKE